MILDIDITYGCDECQDILGTVPSNSDNESRLLNKYTDGDRMLCENCLYTIKEND